MSRVKKERESGRAGERESGGKSGSSTSPKSISSNFTFFDCHIRVKFALTERQGISG
jgi:hypothetical protein